MVGQALACCAFAEHVNGEWRFRHGADVEMQRALLLSLQRQAAHFQQRLGKLLVEGFVAAGDFCQMRRINRVAEADNLAGSEGFARFAALVLQLIEITTPDWRQRCVV